MTNAPVLAADYLVVRAVTRPVTTVTQCYVPAMAS